MNALDQLDDNVQTMRDQGIHDATNGYPAFAWVGACGFVYTAGRDGVGMTIQPRDPEYREAFAYARAYAAETVVPAVIRGRR